MLFQRFLGSTNRLDVQYHTSSSGFLLAVLLLVIPQNDHSDLSTIFCSAIKRVCSPLSFSIKKTCFILVSCSNPSPQSAIMHSALFSLLILALSTTAALAAPQSQATTTPFYYAPVTMTFQGGPASYTLTFPADGSTYDTSMYPIPIPIPIPNPILPLPFPILTSTNLTHPDNDLSVSLIDVSGIYDPYYECNYYTTGMKTLVASSQPNGTIAVGPPQPIYAVACQATPGGDSTCLPQYSKFPFCRQQVRFGDMGDVLIGGIQAIVSGTRSKEAAISSIAAAGGAWRLSVARKT